jgi:hypothetical protein
MCSWHWRKCSFNESPLHQTVRCCPEHLSVCIRERLALVSLLPPGALGVYCCRSQRSHFVCGLFQVIRMWKLSCVIEPSVSPVSSIVGCEWRLVKWSFSFHEGRTYCRETEWLYTGSGLVIAFIEHLHNSILQVINNAIADLHTLQITHAKSSQSAFTSRFLVTDVNNGDSLASRAQVLPSRFRYRTACQLSTELIPQISYL